MQWCWELEDWAKFKYDKDLFWEYGTKFFKNIGLFLGFTKCINETEEKNLIIRIILD